MIGKFFHYVWTTWKYNFEHNIMRIPKMGFKLIEWFFAFIFKGFFLSLFAILGLYITMILVWKPIKFVFKHLLRPRRNLRERYGGNWALVTGASDGIGEQICYELAKDGFNLVLLSRTREKLERVASKCEKEFKIETKILEFDFKTLDSPEGVQKLNETLDS